MKARSLNNHAKKDVFRFDPRLRDVHICIVTQMSKRSPEKSDSLCCCPGFQGLFEARFFKALCDPCRIRILAHLAELGGAHTVSEIAECCPTDLSVVSRHLATMRDAGMLEAQKRGKEVYYSVRYPQLAATLRAMAEAVEACCPGDRSRNETGHSA